MTATQYNRINELTAEFSKADNDLKRMEAGIKNKQLAAADSLLPEFAELKCRCTDIEAKLKAAVEEFHAELFPDNEKRSHKTPFGTLKYHKSSSLEFDDEEKVLLLIERECARELDRAAKADFGADHPRFTREQLVRTHEEPNLEALGAFDDATLARFGITRVREDNFSVTPFAMKTDKPGKKEAA